MLSSQQGNRSDFNPGQRVQYFHQNNKAKEPNREQMFNLIDSMLSFEACLYHQVLPLALEGSCLKLGMVNPEDTAAVDYVGRILSYMNCSLVAEPMAADEHQTLLSAYLNYTGTAKASDRVRSMSNGHPAATSAKRFSEKTTTSQNAQSTLILASTQALDYLEPNQKDADKLQPNTDPAPFIQAAPDTPSNPQLNQVAAPVQPNDTADTIQQEISQVAVPVPASESNVLGLEVPVPEKSSVEVLATMPPKNLLQELLGRVLTGGIGRLYFERLCDRGRILWSENGVLQSVVEDLPMSVFQGVINELKHLTHLPLTTVQEPKQVEIERLYQQSRLLLRLRVMPGTHGEEATLQVLRGAALKFYQQQQMAHLSRDALSIAQQLQQKLSELRERVNINPTLSAGQLEALPALNQLVENVELELEALKQLSKQQ